MHRAAVLPLPSGTAIIKDKKEEIKSSVSTLDGSKVLLKLTASYSFRLTCCLAIITQVEKIIVPYPELQHGAALTTS